MIRSLILILALAAGPAWAAGPGLAISGARAVGPPEMPALAKGAPCGVTGSTTIHVTFSDPDGISYAAVELGAAGVRPDVTAQARTWLWLPSYARTSRAYRWRYEDRDGRLASRHTIPVEIDLVPTAGPVWTEIMAKDGKGALTVRRFALVPDACR